MLLTTIASPSSRFDTLVNCVILATCLLVTGAVIGKLWREPSVQTARELKQGDRAETLPGVAYDSSSATVVLFVKSTCQYCTASMPFYATMTKALAGSRTKVVAAGPEDESVIREYFKSNGVSIDQVVTYRGRVMSTPTLAIVDSKGTVRDVWVGQQDAVGEKRILAAISD